MYLGMIVEEGPPREDRRYPVVTETCSSVDPRLAVVGAGQAGHQAACSLLSTGKADAADARYDASSEPAGGSARSDASR